MLDYKSLLIGRCFESSTGAVYCTKRRVSSDHQQHHDTDLLIKRLPPYFNDPAAIDILQDYIEQMNQDEPHHKIALIHDREEPLLVYHLSDGELLSRVLEKRNEALPYEAVILLLKKLQHELSRLSSTGWRHGRLELNSVYLFNTGEVYFLDQVVVTAKQRLLALNIIPWATVPNAEALTASPEVCFGRSVVDQDDVYNLSILGYQLFSQQLPYEDQNSAQALLEQQLPARIKGLGNAQWAILRKGLALRAPDRFLSSKTLLTLLLQCYRQKNQLVSHTSLTEACSALDLNEGQPPEEATNSTVVTPHPALTYLYKHWLVFSGGFGVFVGMWLMSQLMAI